MGVPAYRREILNQMPPILRRVLTLREIQGLSPDTIAEQLDCSRLDVKRLLFRSRREYRLLERKSGS